MVYGGGGLLTGTAGSWFMGTVGAGLQGRVKGAGDVGDRPSVVGTPVAVVARH